MVQYRSLTPGIATLAMLASTVGCGQSGLAPSPATGAVSAGFEAAAIKGPARKLGYDYARYQRMIAKTAHPVHLVRQGLLPASTDQRAWCSPIADQGQLGACTAFAIAKGLREFIEVRNNEQPFTPLSPLFLYYEERSLEGTVDRDSGSTIGEGMKVLQTIGVCPEAEDPYVPSAFAVLPSSQASNDAAHFAVQTTSQLAGLDDAKTALANGQAVAIGMKVHNSFMSIGPDGMMKMPGWSVLDPVAGGHAVCAVGYDDARQVLIVRNSWGTGWGDRGYFYMPYAYAIGGKAGDPNVSEWWTAH